MAVPEGQPFAFFKTGPVLQIKPDRLSKPARYTNQLLPQPTFFLQKMLQEYLNI
jgi:hypothetical protein